MQPVSQSIPDRTMERDQKEELLALQDTLYFIGSGGYLLLIHYVMDIAALGKLNAVYLELQAVCYSAN